MQGLLRITVVALSSLFILIHASGTNASSIATTQSEIAQMDAPQADGVAIISGRVTLDLNSSPLSDVEIILIDPISHNQFVAAETNNEGLYTVTQTLSAMWLIKFNPPDTTYPDLLPEYYNDTYDLASVTPVTAEVGTVTANINASLAAVGQISGRVTAEEDGSPIGQVRVVLYHANSGNEWYAVETDSVSGFFTMTAQAGESYKLFFDPPDTGSYALAYYPDKHTLAEAQAIQLPLDRDTRVEVALSRAGIISGMVTSSWFDKPLESPVVLALDEEGRRVQAGGRFTNDTMSPGPHGPPGHYVIFNLPAGSYQLEFNGLSHHSLRRTAPVTVEAGEQTTGVNARLVIEPTVNSIATHPAVTNTIFMAFTHDPIPVFTTDGGQTWQWPTSQPWIVDESHFASPDHSPNEAVRVGLTPRGDPGEGTRFLVNAGLSSSSLVGIEPGFYRSGDEGQSWADSPIAPPIDPALCRNGDPQTPMGTPAAPNDLYMLYKCPGDVFSRLLVSRNSGVTWQDVTVSDARTLLLYSEAKLMVSPHVANEVYIYNGNLQWYKSTDGGLNWEEKDFPLEYFVFDAENPDFLSGLSTLEHPPYSRVGKRSTDGGNTWQDWVQQPCPNSSYPLQTWLIAHPTQTQTVFLRCTNVLNDGLYRSDSSGDYWKHLTKEPGQLIVPDYGFGTPGRILWAKDDGLYASTDLGESWQAIMPEYRLFTTRFYLPSVASGGE